MAGFVQVGMSKKIEKPIKQEKNNLKNRTEKKLIKILKKPAGPVRIQFYKQKTEPNGKKPSQTKEIEPNRKKPSQNRAKPV